MALVNEAFVRAYLADAEDPLREGLRLSFYNGFGMKPYTRFQIVGINAAGERARERRWRFCS